MWWTAIFSGLKCGWLLVSPQSMSELGMILKLAWKIENSNWIHCWFRLMASGITGNPLFGIVMHCHYMWFNVIACDGNITVANSYKINSSPMIFRYMMSYMITLEINWSTQLVFFPHRNQSLGLIHHEPDWKPSGVAEMPSAYPRQIAWPNNFYMDLGTVPSFDQQFRVFRSLLRVSELPDWKWSERKL